MFETEKLIRFSLDAYKNGLKSHHGKTITQAKKAILDQFGLQIGCATLPWSLASYQLVKSYESHGGSTVLFHGDKISPPLAAFINGCFGHGQDFDDSHIEAQTHPGCVIIPVAFSIGEAYQQAGDKVLLAIIIGMEIMLRLASSVCPACIQNGHHSPPTIGPFAAAITAGLLMGLSQEQLVNAAGIAGSFAGGLVQYTVSGGSVKRIHGGVPAEAGIKAALLAKNGLTGPQDIIEGEKGFWTVFGRGDEVKERLLEKIGENYLLDTLSFKPYNCCYLIHPAIEGFLKICHDNKLKPADIIKVVVGYSNFSISHAGSITQPKDVLGAQFSTSFTLALSLLKEPPVLSTYTQETLEDSDILELANKITVEPDAVAEHDFPKHNGCVVTVYTATQKISLRLKKPTGSPQNPVSTKMLVDKFYKNCQLNLMPHEARKIMETIEHIEDLKCVSQLTCLSIPNHSVALRAKL